jgi:hypothetical protein
MRLTPALPCRPSHRPVRLYPTTVSTRSRQHRTPDLPTTRQQRATAGPPDGAPPPPSPIPDSVAHTSQTPPTTALTHPRQRLGHQPDTSHHRLTHVRTAAATPGHERRRLPQDGRRLLPQDGSRGSANGGPERGAPAGMHVGMFRVRRQWLPATVGSHAGGLCSPVVAGTTSGSHRRRACAPDAAKPAIRVRRVLRPAPQRWPNSIKQQATRRRPKTGHPSIGRTETGQIRHQVRATARDSGMNQPSGPGCRAPLSRWG